MCEAMGSRAGGTVGQAARRCLPARAGLSEVAEIGEGEEEEGGRGGRGVWRLLDKEMMKRERYIYQGGGDQARGGGW